MAYIEIQINIGTKPANISGGGAGKNGRPWIGGGGGSGGLSTPKCLHNNRPVCFGYNQGSGCGRQRADIDACMDKKGQHYAHYCNFFDRVSGHHCLKQHPRCQHR